MLQIPLGPTWALTDDPGGMGSLILHHPDGDLEALVLDSDIDLHVQGLLADMTLVQKFRNTTDQWVEGRYLFPLPPDAVVRGLRMTVGDRTIKGEIQPREEARVVYEVARDAGQIASLVEQQRPNLFTMNLANIAPGETVKVTLDVMLAVSVVEQQLTLSLPTTLTPRYSEAATPDAKSVSTNFVRPEDARGPRLDVTLTIEPLTDYASVISPTHTLESLATGLAISKTPMDRDIVLQWPAQYAQVASVHTIVARHGNERFVQLLANPPLTIDDEKRMHRELIIIVDKSGSMAGVSMRAAIEALNFAIDGLTENDYLNIVAFDDNYHPLFNEPRKAVQAVKRQARQFADSLTANGGTQMSDALSFALNDNKKPSQSLRQIVFITDGSVGYEEVLLQNITRQLGDSRLFTVGIGPSPNTWFLEKAAEAGRGLSVSIRNEHDVAHAINELLNGLTYPILTDIAVQYPNGHGEIYPQPLPDLYAQRPGMWVTRVSEDVDQIIITGKHAGERWRQTIQLPSKRDLAPGTAALDSSAPAIAMHWTQRKIDALMDEQRYSVDQEVNKLAITQLAMSAGLVTPYTSFVAVDAEPVRPDEAHLSQKQVANLIPKGNQMMPVSMPQGATGVNTLAILSLLLGISGLGLLRHSRVRSH